MLFNSLPFLFFFPLVTSLYFITPYKWRWLLLLIASYIFYMYWRLEYIILILISTVIDYYSGYKMSQFPDKKGKRKFLILSLIANIGLLFFFKYFNFFSDTFRQLFNFLNVPYNVPELDILLPVGISFYTFQTLTYTIDVYQDKIKPEKHFGLFALYVSFWPQLVAGPIERAGRLLPQFREKYDFDYNRIKGGLVRMLWGFFKKVVIADRLAIYVNAVYNSPDQHSGASILLATYFFAFQIYCDFSGYSDIAIGAAQVMGFDLMENFRSPYFSKSVAEFWRRWHISLSTWFRDYVYIPLGGNRSSTGRWYYNLMITFLISGLWHGANWTFVIWGMLHGIYLVFSLWSQKYLEKIEGATGWRKESPLNNYLRIFITFHLVLFGWIFFRANTLSEALILIRRIFNNFGSIETVFIPNQNILLSIVFIVFLLVHEQMLKEAALDEILLRQTTWARWTYYVSVTVLIFWFGVFTNNQFIYFQF